MTSYLEQITALGELHGRTHTPMNIDNYNGVEIDAYMKGWLRGDWFLDYELGWKAATSNIELMPCSSEAYIAGYNSGKDYSKQYGQRT